VQQFIAAHTDGLININAVVYELSLLLEREIHDTLCYVATTTPESWRNVAGAEKKKML